MKEYTVLSTNEERTNKGKFTFKKTMGKIRDKDKKIYHVYCRYFLAVNNDTKLSALSFSCFKILFIGPNLAVFILAAFYPWANKWGAFFGNIFGIAFNIWIYVGSKYFPAPPEKAGKLPMWTYRYIIYHLLF